MNDGQGRNNFGGERTGMPTPQSDLSAIGDFMRNELTDDGATGKAALDSRMHFRAGLLSVLGSTGMRLIRRDMSMDRTGTLPDRPGN